MTINRTYKRLIVSIEQEDCPREYITIYNQNNSICEENIIRCVKSVDIEKATMFLNMDSVCSYLGLVCMDTKNVEILETDIRLFGGIVNIALNLEEYLYPINMDKDKYACIIVFRNKNTGDYVYPNLEHKKNVTSIFEATKFKDYPENITDTEFYNIVDYLREIFSITGTGKDVETTVCLIEKSVFGKDLVFHEERKIK